MTALKDFQKPSHQILSSGSLSRELARTSKMINICICNLNELILLASISMISALITTPRALGNVPAGISADTACFARETRGVWAQVTANETADKDGLACNISGSKTIQLPIGRKFQIHFANSDYAEVSPENDRNLLCRISPTAIPSLPTKGCELWREKQLLGDNARVRIPKDALAEDRKAAHSGTCENGDEWRPPVHGSFRVNSCLGEVRVSEYGGTHLHAGLDLAAPKKKNGDVSQAPVPLYSDGPGRIVRAEFGNGYGCYLIIHHETCPNPDRLRSASRTGQGGISLASALAHGDGPCSSLYAHLARDRQGRCPYAGRVPRGGVPVDACTQVALMGSTGASSGRHLHYEMRLGRGIANIDGGHPTVRPGTILLNPIYADPTLWTRAKGVQEVNCGGRDRDQSLRNLPFLDAVNNRANGYFELMFADLRSFLRNRFHRISERFGEGDRYGRP